MNATAYKTTKLIFGTFWNLYIFEFCYSVYNQCESFICLDLIIKNRKVTVERYFKRWISIKLV
jgi:hypothetical protein